MAKIYISSIVAIGRNHVIGKDGDMAWHIPEDFKYFKRTTMGKPILMGRKSYEALGKPLPGRANIVISRTFMEPINADGPFFVKTIDDAMAMAKKIAVDTGANEIFITGGGEIYKETLPITERLYITVIDQDYEGDTYFPKFDWNDWTIISEDKRPGDPAFTFFVLERK